MKCTLSTGGTAVGIDWIHLRSEWVRQNYMKLCLRLLIGINQRKWIERTTNIFILLMRNLHIYNHWIVILHTLVQKICELKSSNRDSSNACKRDYSMTSWAGNEEISWKLILLLILATEDKEENVFKHVEKGEKQDGQRLHKPSCVIARTCLNHLNKTDSLFSLKYKQVYREV